MYCSHAHHFLVEFQKKRSNGKKYERQIEREREMGRKDVRNNHQFDINYL